MKKSLFKSTGRFYKANLHGHTTVSDGKLTPEEAKEVYKAHGYQILAYSDHEVIVPHPELADEQFLPLTAVEYEFKYKHMPYHDPETGEVVTVPNYISRDQVYHIVLIAGKPDETYYPWATRSIVWGNAKEYAQDYLVGEHPRDFSYKFANAAIKDAKDHGFLVTYCHPFWSCNRYDTYAGLENLDFVEIYNYSCIIAGYALDNSPRPLDDLLALGKHVAPTCSDDGHSLRGSCGAATYVRADSLSYEDVIRSLRNHDVFGSNGPVFEEIAFDKETKILTVDCSPVRTISLTSGVRFAKIAGNVETGTVTHAEFDLSEYVDNFYKYDVPERAFIRLTLDSETGKRAFSRGYFLPELMED